MFLLQMKFISIFIVTNILAVPLLALENLPLQMTPLHMLTQVVFVLGFVVAILVLTRKLSLFPVSVNDVFSQAARFAESIVAVLTHNVVDMALHVVL